MKKLYVAASRARHVVCIAMHRDRITEEQRINMQELKGWSGISLAHQNRRG
ncbi:hypothetical protein [Mesorhizobium sp. M0496]|uniref:hypothetical protein n=1 Tax=Mesorhizobium sp. M0496 TaxID=2956952 RepID=UPI0033395A3A